jgi:Cytochrome C oxidase, cbb3-type, subunit III
MLPARILAVLPLGFGVIAMTQSGPSPRGAIEQAAAAPYRDVLLRDARALCSDLTPHASAHIVPLIEGASCESAVQQTFAQARAPGVSSEVASSLRASVSGLRVHGRRASGTFALTAVRPEPKGAAILDRGIYELELEELAGHWLVSSEARMAAVPCERASSTGPCHTGETRLVFVLGIPAPSASGDSIPIPRYVRHAGGRVEREFKAGRLVAAQSGCLACHRIGETGNRGPGPNLTHVGSRLSPRRLEHALLDARAPMPSFNGLPASKRRALVRFLSLLR